MAEWQVPPEKVREDTCLGWVNEATQEGQLWHSTQRGTKDIGKALAIIAGIPDLANLADYRSHLNTNRLKRNVREMVGALANIRPIWGFSSDNSAFAMNALMMNKTTASIYQERFFDRAIKESLQFAAVTCTGWLNPVYRRDLGNCNKGDTYLDAYGSPSILPVQLPASGNFQNAYAVTLMKEVPIYEAHAMFPKHQDQLRPTSSKYWYSPEIRKSSRGNLMKRIFGFGAGRADAALSSDLFCPLRYTYIIDLKLNMPPADGSPGQMIPMGEFGSKWYYEVPFLGQEIPAGRDASGQPIFRKANANDARMYPYRRLIITGENCRLYDGPAFDWHGRLPLIPICVDRWPWEPAGFSLVRDGAEIQDAINSLKRGSMDKHAASLDLALGYDINAVSKKEADMFDPMQPRARIGFDGSMVDKPFAPVVPDHVMQVGAETPVFIEALNSDMDYMMGVNQAVQLAKARIQATKMDENALDALAEGPLVMDIGRDMEAALSELGQQMKYIVLEYYDTRRIMSYVGIENMSREIFDYNPDTLIPSHLPGEDPTGKSIHADHKRARWFADNLRFQIDPHTLHEITQMTQKLLLIQLKKAGVGIDDETLAKAANVPNFGTIAGSTVREKWATQQSETVMTQLRLALIAKTLGLEEGLAGGPGGALGGAPAGPPGNPPKPEGRPPSGQAAPALRVIGDRSTITESPH